MFGGLQEFIWPEQLEGLVATYKLEEDYGKISLVRQEQ